MARLKFLLFALLALGLWAWQLADSSVRQAQLTVDQAEHIAGVARPVFQARLNEERLRLQGLLTHGATVWPTLNKAGSKDGLPQAFGAIRTALQEGLPDSRRSALTLILSSNGSSLVSRGEADPTASAEGLSMETALQAGVQGAIVDAFGTPHQFYAIALPTSAGSNATLAIGSPLVSWELTDGAAKETGLAGVALIQSGKLLASAGPEKAALKNLSSAHSKGVEGLRGKVASLGPLNLPWVGGAPAFRSIASRSVLPGTNLEVMGLVNIEPEMQTLADAQKMSLFCMGGLAVLALGLAFTLGGAPAPGMAITKPGARRALTDEVPAMNRGMGGDEPLAMKDAEVPESHPEEFDFSGLGGSSPSSTSIVALDPLPPPVPTQELPAVVVRQQDLAPETLAGSQGYDGGVAEPHESANTAAENDFSSANSPEPESFPSSSKAPRPPEAVTQPPMGYDFPPPPPPASFSTPVPPRPGNMPAYMREPPAEDEQRTTIAHPSTFVDSQSSAQSDDDFNPDQTRVASVPAELIERSARESTVETTAAQLEINNEESHYQRVYRDFVTTRERCNESADGLTYERFAQKLRKNRDQLIQKYACKTVRFQVYIKEGKAALKATPVRD